MRYTPLLLLLFVCSCFNPSGEVRDSFEKINNSIERSSATVEDRMDSLRTLIKTDVPGSAIYTACQSYDAVVHFTDSIETMLKQVPDADVRQVNQLMVRKQAGAALYDKLENCYTSCHAAVKKAATIDSVFSWPPEEKNAAVWARHLFSDMPAFTAITILNKLKMDCANALLAALQEMATIQGRR